MVYKVSVIIPTFNSENYIENTINSVFNQTIGFENIELIIVDDCSKDSTRDILKKYDKYPNIKCIFQEKNSGSPSNGRNVGIDNANAKYVMFLDNDDIYVESICEVLYNTINETNTDVVMCNHYNMPLTDYSSDFENDIDASIEYLYTKKDYDVFLKNLMWDKIFKLDFLKTHDIKCPVGYFREDIYFCTKVYLNTDEVPFLKNYYGYVYNERYKDEDLSFSKNIKKDFLLNNIHSEYFSLDLLKSTNNQEIINYNWGKIDLPLFIRWFIIVDADYSSKKDILKELWGLIVFSNFNGKISGVFWRFFYKFIVNKHFTITIIFAKIIYIIYNTPVKNIYRKILKIKQ